MNKQRTRLIAVLIIVVIWSSILPSCGIRMQSGRNSAEEYVNGSNQQADVAVEASWIVKWSSYDIQDEHIISRSVVLSEQPEMAISIMRPTDEANPDEWLSMLKQSKFIQYVEPNQRVSTMATAVRPNDPYEVKQLYLKQIKADIAWSYKKKSPEMVIAIVDTGVDSSHPDLKGNLVQGINLLDASQPEDDNGHGTNVAGVIAAVGDNGIGTTGVTWSAKIMPVKALDSRGYGDEDKLGAGILYAVDHGAKIVVMSVGLYRYSNYMQDIVNYAEQKGVLLIAATGNDGDRYSDKIEIKYPAAYPSVLAVGGILPDMEVDSRSNSGPEIDVVAPWHVFTTSMGGGYRPAEGTSMSAPQVAGVAALVWSINPSLKPYQIREHLRRTAQDVGETGWDSSSGYGMLRADKAVMMKPQNDSLSSNATRTTARVFPVDTMQSAIITAASDSDWYRVDSPYDGVLKLNLSRIEGNGQINVRHYTGNSKSYKTYSDVGKNEASIRVNKGVQYLQLQSAHATKTSPVAYKIWTHLEILDDPFEPNDRQYEAYSLNARRQQITGTFSHKADEDWYVIQLPYKGTLSLKVSTDTVRIDPLLQIKGAGLEYTKLVDENVEGQAELIVLSDLGPGKLYLKVENAVTAKAEPVAGEYTLFIDYARQYTDPNEPNDKQYEAVTISPDTDYYGVFHDRGDTDWFQFVVDEPVYGSFHVKQIPSNRTVQLKLYKNGSKPLLSAHNAKNQSSMETEMKLDKGTYYVQLTTDNKFDQQSYAFQTKLTTLIAGVRDIGDHWARDAIVHVLNKGWMNGYSDARFEPNQTITRAEAASVLAKVFELQSIKVEAGQPSYQDVGKKHWAYQAIEQATLANIVNGYKPGWYGPSMQVTRAQMAVMMGNGLQLQPGPIVNAPFADVSVKHWAAPMLSKMKSSGLLGGNPNNMFNPDRNATRAEFVALLQSVVGK